MEKELFPILFVSFLSGCMTTPKSADVPLILQASAWWELGAINKIVCVPVITNIKSEPITVRAFTLFIDAEELPDSWSGGMVLGGERIGQPHSVNLRPGDQIFTRLFLENYDTNRTTLLTVECDDVGGYPFPPESGKTWEGKLTTTIAVPPSNWATLAGDFPEIVRRDLKELGDDFINGFWCKNSEYMQKPIE